jgi:hypothetical protein
MTKFPSDAPKAKVIRAAHYLHPSGHKQGGFPKGVRGFLTASRCKLSAPKRRPFFFLCQFSSQPHLLLPSTIPCAEITIKTAEDAAARIDAVFHSFPGAQHH